MRSGPCFRAMLNHQACTAEHDDMLEEATGLSADYREVKRLRRLLAAARTEATTALAEAHSPVKTEVEAAAPLPARQPRLPGSPPASPGGDAAESGCSQCRRLKQQLDILQVRPGPWCRQSLHTGLVLAPNSIPAL